MRSIVAASCMRQLSGQHASRGGGRGLTRRFELTSSIYNWACGKGAVQCRSISGTGACLVARKLPAKPSFSAPLVGESAAVRSRSMVGKLVQSVQPDSAVTLSVPGVEEQAMRMRFDIPDWAGADREALIYKSVTDFTPIGLTMISGRLFNAPVRPDIVHEVVVWQLAKRRAGTAKQKGRSEVHYSTRKLRPQKGTGRARLGSRGAMHLVGGGRAHPKRPRNFDYPLPVPFRRNGLRSVLTTKYASGHLWIVENCDIPEVNSLILEDAFVKLGWESVMICDWNANGERNVTTNTDLAQLPMENVLMIKPEGLNVYDLLSFDHVVLTLPALHKLEERYTMHNELY